MQVVQLYEIAKVKRYFKKILTNSELKVTK